jgi:hypothetical protein
VKPFRCGIAGALAACCVFAIPKATHAAAKIVIVNANTGTEGFNDKTDATPVAGNAGITVGQQRLIAFKYAAGIWGTALAGTITVSIQSQFTKLTCSDRSGVLGQAGPRYLGRSGPLPDVWYPGALACQIVGQDLGQGTPAIVAQFNSGIGPSNCLPGTSWYYGLDGNTGPSQFDLAEVVLHEFAHGLGFLTLTNIQTGKEFAADSQSPSYQDVWEFNMLDLVTQKHWNQMSDAERAASALRPRKLVWDGASVISAVPNVLSAGTPTLTVNSPPSIAGEYLVGDAQFGPRLSSAGITSNLSAPLDANGNTTACTAPLSSPLSGTIALVDRGICPFVTKVKNAQVAGAVAVVVADNGAGSPPIQMGGTDPTISIPSVLISQNDGAALRNALTSGTVVVNEHVLPVLRGADDHNRALLYTPDQFKMGSSVVHTDTIAALLMDPSYNTALGHKLDLTPYFLNDMGWSLANPNPTGQSADISISATGPSSVKKGSSVSYDVTVTNDGPSDGDDVTVFFGTKPSDINFASSSGDCANGFPCSLALAAHTSRSFTATFNVPSSFSGDTMQATINAAPPFADPAPANNVANVNTSVSGGCSSTGAGKPLLSAVLLLLGLGRKRSRRSKIVDQI